MNRVRTAVVLAASIPLVLGLTGCEKPTPGASVTSGTTTAFGRAICWAFDSDGLDAGQCAEDLVQEAATGPDVPKIPVIPGQTIGISVDPTVADAGWTPVIGGQRMTATPLTGTYFRFVYPDLQAVPAEGLEMQILAGKDTKTRGIWVYKLVPAGE